MPNVAVSTAQVHKMAVNDWTLRSEGVSDAQPHLLLVYDLASCELPSCTVSALRLYDAARESSGRRPNCVSGIRCMRRSSQPERIMPACSMLRFL